MKPICIDANVFIVLTSSNLKVWWNLLFIQQTIFYTCRKQTLDLTRPY